jgi:hypothetical protein
MAAPTTPVDICNLALDRCGQRSISSITAPTTEVEEICARQYDSTLSEILRRYVFNFAKKYAVLTVSGTKVPAFGYTSAYALPNDFVRLLTLGDITVNDDVEPGLYDLSEGFIFTDVASAGSLKMTYIHTASTIISKWDPLFVRLLVLHLAANLAFKLSLKNSMIQAIRDDAADVALAAAAVAGQEKPPRRIERSKMIGARNRGMGSGDNTHYE